MQGARTCLVPAALLHRCPPPRPSPPQVDRLQSRLAAAEAELAAQLAAKQHCQSRLGTQAAELAALERERELLQQQAVGLQQEVSAMLRGSPSSAGMAAEQTLERSPSRALGDRMRALLSGHSSGHSSSSGGSHPASPTHLPALAEGQAFEPPQPLLENLGGLAGGGALPAHLLAGAEEPAPRPLGSSLCTLRDSQAARDGEAAAREARLREEEGRLREQQAALTAARRAYEAEASLLRGRTAAAEEAAAAVLDLHASQVGQPRAAAGEGGCGEHQQCRAALESLHAQMWRERLGRQRCEAEAVEARLRLSGQLAASGGGAVELDEGALAALEAEMAGADQLSQQLRRVKVRTGGASEAGWLAALHPCREGQRETARAPCRSVRSHCMACMPRRRPRRPCRSGPSSWS